MADERGGWTGSRIPGAEAVRTALALGEQGEARRGRRRLVPLAWAAGLVLAAGIAVLVLRHRPATPPLANPSPEQLMGGQLLRPLRAPAPGSDVPEAVSAFSGFAISVETDPPGAVVTVAGKVLGEAPVLAGLDCEPEKAIEIRAEKPGFLPGSWTTRCRVDSVVKVRIPLSRR